MGLFLQRFNDLLGTGKAALVIVVGLLAFNASLYYYTGKNGYTDKQARKATSGFALESASPFVYFYYYTGYFPIATLNKQLTYSKDSAEKELKENGKDLIMEYLHWTRTGEQARIWAFLPDLWVSGSPEHPSIKLFNVIVFNLSLLILFWGFRKVGLALMGLVLVVFINLTPYFIYEVFVNINIFGLMASAFFIILGLNMPVLFKKNINIFRYALIAGVSGMLLGFFTEMRNEISVVLVSLMLIYLLSVNIKWMQKLALVVLIYFSYAGVKAAIQAHFESKYATAHHLVTERGGHPYNGYRTTGHNVWHNIFVGLGDYDTKHGYIWCDTVAYVYAAPIIRERFQIDPQYTTGYNTNAFYDKDSLYYKKLDEIPGYDAIIGEKVLADIAADPAWYITILLKRIVAMITVTLPKAYIGWLIFPLFVYLIKMKRWDFIKLLVISLPLSASCFIVYSAQGATYNSVFPFFIIAIVVHELFEFLKGNGVRLSKP